MRRFAIVFFCGFGVSLSVANSQTFTVTATAALTCSITTANNVNLGLYSGSALAGSTTLTVSCSGSGTMHVEVDLSSTNVPGTRPWRLKRGATADYLQYRVDTSGTGNGYINSLNNSYQYSKIVTHGPGSGFNYNPRFIVDAGQLVHVGSYSDQVIATVTVW